jgi:general nucleoside transport system permease protein
MDILTQVFSASVFASMIRLATPYIFAAIGETFSQRSGVLNLGVDGIMLLGAFAAYYVVFLTGNLLLGILAAIIAGGLLGLMMAFISVTLQAEQGISGIGLYLFGLGFSELLFQQLVGTPESVNGFQRLTFPILSDIPYIGEVFFNHNLLVYIAFLMVPIAAFVLNRTTFGLNIRAVGQNPQAADAVGVRVGRIRYMTVTFGGIMAGLAGASLSIALLKVFQQNLTSGMGFIAVALVYFGGWRPFGVLAGALLFSFVNALQLQVQVLENQFAIFQQIPSEFAVMAPYVITIIALALASNQREQPTALTKPFDRSG